jgi:pimeloyl-ACP methyl ester carboxylesterase
MSLASGCGVVLFSDYSINENPESSLGEFVGGSSLWHRATGSGETCFIPYTDILEGHRPANAARLPTVDSSAVARTELVASAGHYYSPAPVTPECGVIMSCAETDPLTMTIQIEQAKTPIDQDILSNLEDHFAQEGVGIADTCQWALNGKNKGSKKYEDILEWCFENGFTESDLLKYEVFREMDAHFDKTMDLEGTKRWGQSFYRNINNTAYGYVLDWYNEVKSYNINVRYYARGRYRDHVFDPEWDIWNGLTFWRKVKTDSNVTFSIAKERKYVNQYRSNGDPVFLLIHGWKDNPDSWADDMGRQILRIYGNRSQILAIDWSDIATTRTNSEKVASTWIDSIAVQTVEALNKWRIDPNNTTIISHSIGTVLGEEISERLGGVNSIVLEPTQPWFLKYRIDETNSKKFQGFSGDERCLIGSWSAHGSEAAAQKCKERYLVDYYNLNNHSLIEEYFEEFKVNLVTQGIFTLGKQQIPKALKKVELKQIDWNLAPQTVTKAGTTALLTASITIDDIKVDLAEAKIFATKKFVGALAKQGCTLTAAGTGPLAVGTKVVCNAAIVTAVNEVIDNIVDAVNEHSWVAQTYTQILTTPFYNSILSVNDRRNFAEMDRALNKPHNGVIYTEREDPDAIKYLKVLPYEGASRYTLYGTTTPNTLDCKFDKGCDMYGGSGENYDQYSGERIGDTFLLSLRTNHSTLLDFKSDKEPDRIQISKDSSELLSPNSEADIGSEPVLEITKVDVMKVKKTKMRIQGYTREEVREWVSIADGSYRETEEGRLLEEPEWRKKQEKNPIQIK